MLPEALLSLSSRVTISTEHPKDFQNFLMCVKPTHGFSTAFFFLVRSPLPFCRTVLFTIELSESLPGPRPLTMLCVQHRQTCSALVRDWWQQRSF